MIKYNQNTKLNNQKKYIATDIWVKKMSYTQITKTHSATVDEIELLEKQCKEMKNFMISKRSHPHKKKDGAFL